MVQTKDMPEGFNCGPVEMLNMIKKLQFYSYRKSRLSELSAKFEYIFHDGVRSVNLDRIASGKTNKFYSLVEDAAIHNYGFDSSTREVIEVELLELQQLQEWIVPLDNLLSWLDPEDKEVIIGYFQSKAHDLWNHVPGIINRLVWLEQNGYSQSPCTVRSQKKQYPKQFQRFSRKVIQQPSDKKQDKQYAMPARADPWDEYRSFSNIHPWKKIRPYTPTTNLLIVQLLEEGRDLEYISKFLDRDLCDLQEHIDRLKNSKTYARLMLIVRPRLRRKAHVHA